MKLKDSTANRDAKKDPDTKELFVLKKVSVSLNPA
jgi:hypothetical protein